MHTSTFIITLQAIVKRVVVCKLQNEKLKN
jgi:hypothetical protein